GSLLDRSAGSFRFAPDHVHAPSHRRYLPGSMVLETTWHTHTGWMVVRDALVMAPWTGGSRSAGRQRPPSDFTARGALVRTATCIEGQVDVFVDCLPLFDYGRSVGTWEYAGDGYNVATCAQGNDGLTLRLGGTLPLGLTGARASSRVELRKGQTGFICLSWGDVEMDTVEEAVENVEVTTAYWRDWLQRAEIPDHAWRPYLERSALTLKGLSYGPSGAIMAASTTSLPETPGGERNWDYRFTWIRDSAFILRALFELGFDWEAFQYYAFIIDAIAGGPLQIMYGIGGERELTEHVLDHLSGYEGAKPVRTGNGAYDQQQHDVWGMVMDSVAVHVAHASQLGPLAWHLVTSVVENAIAVWQEPDRGIWEVRGEPKHFTSSKVMCWVAADRGATLAAGRGATEQADTWRQAADTIQADICARGVDDRGVFTQQYGSKALDASVLLVPLMGFLPPDDDRVKATVLAIADELTSDGLVLRYRTDETDDGLSGEEGSFTICSFWLVSALAIIGERERAHALCEKLLSFASPLHLYAEEIEASSGRHLGNFPQAFTHLALIDAVTRVIALESDGRRPSAL
ncbi:MAG TPA: glycoside hydrolase family 15 protein, partial [Acidimicrobiales bacterium]|nr:glycoside hydrolase family 15 protein [Acidimicrobiales bacterium]